MLNFSDFIQVYVFTTNHHLNQCIDFEIIMQECSLGECLPKLLKPFHSVEQDGRQS